MTAALILAAGKTARAGELDPQAPVGTISALQRVALVFQQAGIERVVVVCGEDGDQAKKLTAHMSLEFLESPGGADLLDNVKAGLAYLQDKCADVLISLVDVPLCSVETVRTLMEAEGPACAPSYHGSVGHPMLLRAEHIPAVLSYEGSGGLLGAVKAAGLPCRLVPVEDPGVLTNARTGEERTQLIEEHDLARLRLDFRVRLMREKAFYGPGTHQLLQLTEETGSLLEACRHMGISYSKGRKIIATTEQQLGYPVIESQQGGRTGGRSALTEQGKALIRGYAEFYTRAKQTLEELFQTYFGADL